MKKRRRYLLASLALTLLLSVACSLASLSYWGYRVESLGLDTFFSLRQKVFGNQAIDPRIVLVGIDEETIQFWGKPQVFWQPELVKLVNSIREGEPKVIGLDFVTSPVTHGLEPSDPLQERLDNESFELGMCATESPLLLLSEIQSADTWSKVEQGANPDEVVNAQTDSPPEIITELLLDSNGDSTLAVVNSPTDADSGTRRAKLFTRDSNKDGSRVPQNFAFLLLKHGIGEEVELQSEALVWRGEEVPYLFDESFLINFPGPMAEPSPGGYQAGNTGSFPVYSAKDVISLAQDPAVFRDKIVIIAPIASSLDDYKVVPLDPIYPGAGVHASVVNMFINETFIQRSPWTWWVFTGLFCAVGLIWGRKGQLIPALLTVLALPMVAFMAFVTLRWWLPCVLPFLAALLSALAGYGERLLTVERDRQAVRATFARMVSPQVMDYVMDNHDKLRNGEKKLITVLFADINDFTPICERHTPEEVIHMLSDYFSLMVDAIMKYDGYIKQYVGDEIMVIFGAPEESEDHATRAVLAALEMREALDKARETAQGKPGFYEVKIGVNTGPAVVGKVGPDTRWEYAAVGDDVNLGARVMSAAKNLGKEIGISAATKARYEKERKQGTEFEDHVAWTSMGVQSFKGKTSQMEVFDIDRE